MAWPSRQPNQHARGRIRQMTARPRLLVSVAMLVQELNRFLRGWAGTSSEMVGSSVTRTDESRFHQSASLLERS